jgi:hypothetical protein
MKKLRDMATSQSSLFDIDTESQRTKLKPLRQELIEVPSLASIYAPMIMKTLAYYSIIFRPNQFEY